jgi:hypothetical protein
MNQYILAKLFVKSALLFWLGTSLGCVSNTNTVFIQALHEHKQNTQTVNNSLVATYKEEQAKENRPEAIKAYQEIIDNLNSVTHEAEVLDGYMLNTLSEEELIALFKKQLSKGG